jgi:hypothetical protein
MSQLIELKLTPEEAKNESIIRAKLLSVNPKLKDDFIFRWKKRSFDARSRNIKVNALFEIFSTKEEVSELKSFPFRDVRNAEKIHIVGAGPATQTVFSIEEYLYTATSLSSFSVTVNGELYRPDLDYTYANGDITFITVPGLGARIIVASGNYWKTEVDDVLHPSAFLAKKELSVKSNQDFKYIDQALLIQWVLAYAIALFCITESPSR